MSERLPALIFGSLLILGALGMLSSQRRTAGRLDTDAGSDRERQYLRTRTRRRSQVAGLLLLIGIMIIAGDSLMQNWSRAPLTFAVYWLIVLGLAFWIGILAVADLLATKNFMTREIHQLERKQLELQNLARGLRQAKEQHGNER